MSPRVQHLIADAAAFISNAPLRELAGTVYTVPEVIEESCDKVTRRRLKVTPVELTYREPSAQAMTFVIGFSKQTGDYGSLSQVDLKVLALTYDLAKQHEGETAIKRSPDTKPAFIYGASSGQPDNVVTSEKVYADGDVLPSDLILEGSEEEEEAMDNEGDSTVKAGSEGSSSLPEERTEGQISGEETVDNSETIAEESEEEEEDIDEDDDDDEGWITPSNIAAVKRSMGVGSAVEQTVCVGCLTTDFAVQNVLVQMGLKVISLDGKLIQQVKTYVLRCFGCMKITKDTSKKFCPHCGNQTLRRLSTSLAEDGTVRYHLARNYTNRIRGLKFSLPKPMGGKHALNPKLCADQPQPDQRLSKKALQKVDILSADIVADSSPFKMNDVTSKAAQLGLHKVPQWAKRNPNENNRRGNKKRKK